MAARRRSTADAWEAAADAFYDARERWRVERGGKTGAAAESPATDRGGKPWQA